MDGRGAIDALGHLAQSQFAQRGQILLAEKVFQRRADLFGRVDLSRFQAIDEVFDGQIEVDDLIGFLEEGVGHRFTNDYAGGPLDDVLETFQMLDVERTDHVDSGVQNLFNILIPLVMARAGRIGMGQLVDDGHRRVTGENCVEVHIFNGEAAVFDATARDDFQPFQQGGGFGAAVGLNKSNHHVGAAFLQGMRLFEHPVGLADPGCEAHVELEPPALERSTSSRKSSGRG